MEPWYTRISRVVLVRLAIAGVIGIFGYLKVSDSKVDEATRDTSGEVTESGDVGIYVLQIGDCFLYPTSDFSSTAGIIPDQLKVIPCTELHDAEVGGNHTLPDGPFPGVSKFAELEQSLCRDDYNAYTKTNLESPPHGGQSFYPTEESWANGDRLFTCTFSFISGEKLGASIRG